MLKHVLGAKQEYKWPYHKSLGQVHVFSLALAYNGWFQAMTTALARSTSSFMDSLSPVHVHVSTPRSACRGDDASSTGKTEENQQATKTEAVEITHMYAHLCTCTHTHTQYNLFHGVIHLTHFMCEVTPHSCVCGPWKEEKIIQNYSYIQFLVINIWGTDNDCRRELPRFMALVSERKKNPKRTRPRPLQNRIS